MRALRRSVLLAASVAVGAVIGVEAVAWWSSRRRTTYGGSGGDGTEALIVLGYMSRPDGTHPVQRWRCVVASRSRDPARPGLVVFTGRGRAEKTEAEVMATYASETLGVPDEEIVLEQASMTTWENVANAAPLVEHAEVIKIISDPVHAARGRRYLREMRPDLAARLAPADDYRFLEAWSMKLSAVTYAALFEGFDRFGRNGPAG